MSYADKVFIEMCRDIIDNGTSTEEKGTPGMRMEPLRTPSKNLAL